MKVVRGRAALAAAASGAPRTAAFAVGNFDGVHLGHQALLRAARERADDRGGGEVAVLTFDPHPARLFAPALAPPLIVSLARRLELLGEAGADRVVVEPFTPEFAAIEAAPFVRDVLARDLGARDVVVGYDFSFGRGRKGDTRLLAQEGAALGMGVTIVPPVTVNGLTCSSTKVREFVLEGRVEGAAMLLGRPFEIAGQVVRGAGRGRGLGIPTANVMPDGELLPRTGIYAARAVVLEDDDRGGGGRRANGGAPPDVHVCALSIGTNPTFTTAGAVTVEAHLLDFDADLYGRRLRLQIYHRLRDERRFESSDALMAQIADDLARTREMMN
jgi:riboflavin kinase/FMN adenylyltransferase